MNRIASRSFVAAAGLLAVALLASQRPERRLPFAGQTIRDVIFRCRVRLGVRQHSDFRGRKRCVVRRGGQKDAISQECLRSVGLVGRIPRHRVYVSSQVTTM